MPSPKSKSNSARKPVRKPAASALKPSPSLDEAAPSKPQSIPSPEETLTVEVRGLALGGAFASRVTGPAESPRIGMTAFVPFVAPGETATVVTRRIEERFLEADPQEVETPSPDRATPPCPYFGSCGGCDVQHLTYEAQLRAKADMVRSAFAIGKLPNVAERVADVTPGPPLGYRRRISLHVDGRGQIGYFARRTHRVLSVAQCPIAQAPLTEFLSKQITFDGLFNPLPDTPDDLPVADLSLEAGESGPLVVLRVGNPKSLPTSSVPYLVERLAPHVAGGVVRSGAKLITQWGAMVAPDFAAQGFRAETAGYGIAEATAGHFSQVNSDVNRLLTAHIEAIAAQCGARTACDLYTGSGNFALPLAARGIQTLGVEEVPELVAAARQEAERRNLTARVAFQENTVERFLLDRPAPKAVDLVVADPPRAGLGKLTSHLMPASTLALISCDLASAVRDVRNLVAGGWHVETVTPYDMFAQTAHVELVTHLRRM